MSRVPGPEMLASIISPTGEVIVQGIKKVPNAPYNHTHTAVMTYIYICIYVCMYVFIHFFYIYQIPVHIGPVSALCFLDEGSRLVTAGVEDGLIKVWKVTYDLEEREIDVQEEKEEAEAPPAATGEEGEGEANEAGKSMRSLKDHVLLRNVNAMH
jgi:WD40 repeat protein